jgi:hypothetical protein
MLDDEIDFDRDMPVVRLAAWSLRADDQRRVRMTLRFEDAAGNAEERGGSVSVLLPAEAALYLSAELGRQALAVDAEASAKN